jgi:hypothetical protein
MGGGHAILVGDNVCAHGDDCGGLGLGCGGNWGDKELPRELEPQWHRESHEIGLLQGFAIDNDAHLQDIFAHV